MEARIERVQSHSVTLGYRGELEREECYPRLSVIVRGEQREVTVSCDRYVSTAGLGSWRWYITSMDPGNGIGDATRAKVREAIAPLVEGWLAGTFGTAESGPDGNYRASRARAYARAVANEIRAMRTTADYRAKAALDANADELSGDDRLRLRYAYDSMLRALELLS